MPEDPQGREFLSIFLMEAWDTLATLEDGLGRLREPGTGAESVEPLLVVTHRLKGAAALHGFPELARVAGVTEQMLERAPAVSSDERRGTIEFLGDLVAVLKKVLDGIGVTGREDLEELVALRTRHPVVFAGPSRGEPASAVAGSPPPAASGISERLLSDIDRFFAENSDILAYFAPEAAEHLEVMTRSLLALERTGASEEELATLFRAVHTLKGAAYTVGCTAVGDLAHRVEDLLGMVREGHVALTPAVVEAVFAGVDALRLLLGAGEGPPPALPAALERAVAALTALMPAAAPEPGEVARTAPAAPAPPVTARPELPRPSRPVPAVPRRPLVVRPGIRVNLERLDSLMNLVGELVIARSRLDRGLGQLNRVGELLLFSRARMTRAVRDFEGKHQAGATPLAPVTGEPAAPAGVGAPAPVTHLFAELEFDRYDDFDILARSVAEISADLSEVQTQLAGLIRSIWEDTAQIQRLTGSLRNEITRTRMVPVGKLFARFARQVREAAKAAGKTVALEVSGETVEVDNTIIEQISDPLLHLVQNAIAHGIESEEERRTAGKPPQGTVYLSAYHRGGFVYVEVEDDGRGIDVNGVKDQAVRQGFLPPDAAALLGEREALDLIFLRGFSTAPLVTTAAGRGVGMDVVRTNVSRLNGEIEVETEIGVGTRFTIKLPLTLVISDALMVRAGGETLAVPLNAVQLILTVRPREVQSVGQAEMVRVEDQLVDLIRMTRVLALPPSGTDGQIPVVVLRAGGRSVAVAVDALLGKEEIVIKGLGDFLEGATPFAGATISGEGRVILLVDPARLVEAGEEFARGAGGADVRQEAPPPAARRAPDVTRRVLLVDDSISVRKFVGHMLEKAGFHVITANDGAEALQRLTESSVHAVITDLEMPRVNGYELIDDLRRRPSTRNLPIVVLTTRAGEKHVTLARQLGVRHYVSKPVDEAAFVRLIGSLTALAAEPALTEAAR